MNIYTDGAASNNGKKNCSAGIGIYIENTDICISENITKTILDIIPEYSLIKPTNNIAELLAILKAITISLNELNNKLHIIIYTDSMYCINSLTKWYKLWERNNWKTSKNVPVLNKEIIQKILTYTTVYSNLKLKYTPAHKKEPLEKYTDKYQEWYGNKIADELAVKSICVK